MTVATNPTATTSSISAGTAPAASPSTATKPPLLALHDAAQQAGNLRSVLQDDKQRIGCFLGAGCPLGIYDEAGTKSIALIPAVVDLTKKVDEQLKAERSRIAAEEAKKAKLVSAAEIEAKSREVDGLKEFQSCTSDR